MREILVMFIPLIFPAILLAKVPLPRAMIEKIIRLHGTYLQSVEPMPCSKEKMGPIERQQVIKLFNKVAHWPNFRAMYPGRWEVNMEKCKLPVADGQCQIFLTEKGVKFKKVSNYPAISNPVELEPVIYGVTFLYKEPLIIGCDLALAMAEMARIFSTMGIVEVGIMSAYRPVSEYSFHSLGLAIDVNYLKKQGEGHGFWVKTAFEKNKDYGTCDYTAETIPGRILLDAVCSLWHSKVFNTIITPNYNEGHANHFHFDIRPGDNRFYLR